MRELGAFFLAPVPAAALGVVLAWLMGASMQPASVMLFYLVSLYIVQVFLGLPLRLALRKFGGTAMTHFAAAGAAMVAMPAVPYVAWATGRQYYPLASAASLLALWIGMGAITGLLFWAIARPDRPAATGHGGALLQPVTGNVLRAQVTVIDHYVEELLQEPDDAAADALWLDIATEAEHVLRQRAPSAFCAARSWEQRLSCMIKLPDGRIAAEMIDLRDISEERLGAIGERLRNSVARAPRAGPAAAGSRSARPTMRR